MLALCALAPASGLTSMMIARKSSAAFSATTSNTGNSLSATALSLTDNDAGSALFDVTGMRPGAVTACIRITYAGDVDDIAAVRMYGAYTVGDLLPYLNIAVDRSATGTAADCSDFGTPSAVQAGTGLGTFLAARTAFSNGVDVWTPSTASESMTLRITLTLADDNLAMNKSVSGLAFTWEIQTI